MKPSIGRTVHVIGFQEADEVVAGIITKVCGDKDHDPAVHGGFAIVNLTMFPDGHIGQPGRVIPLFETRFKADQYLIGKPVGQLACFWPERV
jgi:hypothetical protein